MFQVELPLKYFITVSLTIWGMKYMNEWTDMIDQSRTNYVYRMQRKHKKRTT